MGEAYSCFTAPSVVLFPALELQSVNCKRKLFMIFFFLINSNFYHGLNEHFHLAQRAEPTLCPLLL